MILCVLVCGHNKHFIAKEFLQRKTLAKMHKNIAILVISLTVEVTAIRSISFPELVTN